MDRILDVYLNTDMVGQLVQNKHGEMLFSYDASWLNHPSARPLSNSLPLRKEPFSRNECRGFFAGVLPEEENREIIARNLGISARNDFSLLEQIGGECAGAVTFVPAGSKPPPSDGLYRKLSGEDLETILKALPTRPLLAGNDGIRLSLAGVQDKIAIRFENGIASIPLEGAPSTHIIKPAIDRFEGIVFNEAFCMQLAKEAKIPVATTSVGRIGTIDYLLIERYDRVRDAQGHIVRLHQEDFCQALGLPPEQKYQSEGGPSLVTCIELIRAVSSVPVIDIQRFLDMVFFNLLIGNCDAHGKNFSLLNNPDSTRLAPLYDAVSTVYYQDLSTKMAMKLGGEYAFDNLQPRHIEKLAADADLSKALLKDRVVEVVRRTLKALNSVLIEHPVANELQSLIATRCESVSSRFA